MTEITNMVFTEEEIEFAEEYDVDLENMAHELLKEEMDYYKDVVVRDY